MNRVPSFPGKPAQTGAQPNPEPWKERMCPYSLSGAVARLGPPTPELLATLGKDKTADEPVVPMPCMGKVCTLWAVLPDGSMGCTHNLQLVQMMRLNQNISALLDAITDAQQPANASDATAPATSPTTPA